MASSSQIALGALKPWSSWGEFNNLSFLIQQALSKLQTATLVKVQACSNDGGVSPIGTVDVLPLVNQLDGNGNPTPHVTVFGLPYLRIQGGTNAVIMDPQVGDIGVAVFASRDISKVKSTQAQANPGSGRRYSFADGVYLSTVLGAAAPQQYIQVNSEGITVLSPQAVTLTAPSIQMGASGSTSMPLMTRAFLNYFTSTVIPALAAHGITVADPPSDSITTSVEGA
jgi:hypothetical protein